MDDQARTRAAADKLEIHEMMFRFSRATDARSPEELAIFDTCATPDLEVDYPFGSWRGLTKHKARVKATMMEVFAFTQHIACNPIVTVQGDRARADYKVMAAHGLAAPAGRTVLYGGADYSQDLVRTPAGWRISRHRCDRFWIDDPDGLMASATAPDAAGG